MNHDALVQHGRLPWSPNRWAADLDVWHQYEHPVVGTFRCCQQVVLFSEIVGFDSRLSVWAYACLTPDEVQQADTISFASPEELHEYTDRLLSDRKVVLALADDQLTRHWSVTDEPGLLADHATKFLNQVLESVHPRRDATTMLRAKLAQVDVATADLVDA